MPINAFGGGPGSGKTYGVMEHVILPAIAKGRFVITNIDGLNDEAIYEYVVENFFKKGKIGCIGHIRHCDRNAPEDENFFPGEDAHDKGLPVPPLDLKVAYGGDLVVIDEATRYWVQGERVHKNHAYFFREHRHFANEMGHTCDLVVIDPDLTQLARALKGKVEMTSLTHKPKELGLNKYVVQLFRGVKFTGKPVSVGGPYPFKPEIYALYRSYAVTNASEQSIDSRQSQVPALVRKLVFMVLLVLSAIALMVYAVRHKMQTIRDADTKKPPEASSPVSGGSAPVGAAGAPVGALAGPVARSDVSSTLRIVGEMTVRGDRWVIMSDGAHMRLESGAAFAGKGMLTVGQIEGQRVTTWSGPAAVQAEPSAPVRPQ
jgi:zona occludens toxin